jgi:hypothetical protein
LNRIAAIEPPNRPALPSTYRKTNAVKGLIYNVIGTKSAMVAAADIPGNAPTTTPIRTPITINPNTDGSLRSVRKPPIISITKNYPIYRAKYLI